MKTSKFDWKTENDGEWVYEAPAQVVKTAVSRRNWLYMLILLIMVAVAGGLLTLKARQQVAEAALLVEADILASHSFIHDAVDKGDEELFYTMLSGRDRRWTDVQTQLMADKLLYGRDGLGLKLRVVNNRVADETPQIMLAPDLRAAELRFAQVYLLDVGDVVSETVVLQHTAVYRRGTEKWLLSPPDDQFWGYWATFRGDILSVSYPLRDEAVALRLASDLDDLIVEICAAVEDINCPPAFTVNLRLDKDPESLNLLADPEENLKANLLLSMPTPTLIGLPVDEVGYEAIYKGVGVQVGTAVIAHLVDFECCRQGIIFRTLVEQQLSRFGLIKWPVQPVDYDFLLDYPGGFAIFNGMWQRNTINTSMPIYTQNLFALVDFLESQYDSLMSIADMQRNLGRVDSVDTWLTVVTADPNFNEQLFAVSWMKYLYHQTPDFQEMTVPIPFPDQVVQLVCVSGNDLGLYHYDPAFDSWTEHLAVRQVVQSGGFVTVLNDPGMYFSQTFSRSSIGQPTVVHITMYHDDELIAIIEQELDEGEGFFLNKVDPTGRYILTGMHSSHGTSYKLLDLEQCDEMTCVRYPLPGWVTWSPDGQYTLISDQIANEYGPFSLANLSLGNERGEMLAELEAGDNPLWLNETHFVYFRRPDDFTNGFELVTATVTDHDPVRLLTAADLLNEIPFAERPELISLSSAAFDWGKLVPEQLVLMARGIKPGQENKKWFFRVELNEAQSAVTNLELVYSMHEYESIQPSSDGQWLILISYDDVPSQIIKLVNVKSGEEVLLNTVPYAFAWSPDSQWLAYNQDGRLVVMLPGTDVRRLAYHSFGDCRQLNWLKNNHS